MRVEHFPYIVDYATAAVLLLLEILIVIVILKDADYTDDRVDVLRPDSHPV